jgi:CRISPR-associated protein Cmr3
MLASTLQTYLIEPKAPLVFRTGRPFGAGSGNIGFAMPPQSALAGAIRSAHVESNQSLDYSLEATRDELQKLSVHGALLVCIRNADDRIIDVFYPQPADRAYVDNAKFKIELATLEPQPIADGTLCNLDSALLPVGHNRSASKLRLGPKYWNSTAIERWASANRAIVEGEDAVESLGIPMLPLAIRTHVGLNTQTGTADEGKLFQSTGIDFAGSLGGDYRYGLLVRANTDFGSALRHLGADGRLVHLQQFSAGIQPWPVAIEADYAGWKQFRLLLVTPAVFSNGYLPDWLQKQRGSGFWEGELPNGNGLRIRLKAVANERWQAISGWEMRANAGYGEPKTVRRTVPAGAVYWFDVISGDCSILKSLWLNPFSDEAADCAEGFGLSIFGKC